MRVATLVDLVKAASLNALILTARDRRVAREYLVESERRFDELANRGLCRRSPVRFLSTQGWARGSPHLLVQLPAALDASGGTRLDELLILAATTAVLQPCGVFAFGTFNGRTTSVFVLNAPTDAEITSLDLPPDAAAPADDRYLTTELELIRQPRVGSLLHDLGIAHRYRQLLCDSRDFDPRPWAGTIELGFIDGAHTRATSKTTRARWRR